MEAMTLLERHPGPWTRVELDALPDDGCRHELIDGTLIVTPSPGFRHQMVVGKLFVLLDRACPEELRVLLSPFDVVLAEDTVVQPDLLVARLDEFTPHDLPVAPLLAVEILSPSTRLYDLNLKRARYQQAGVTAYWVMDPDEVSLTAWELRDGAYVEVARVVGADTFAGRAPYAVEIVPEDLVRP